MATHATHPFGPSGAGSPGASPPQSRCSSDGALAAAQAGARAASSPGSAVTVRVEGPKQTLLAPTSVVLSGGTIVKDGIAADSCSGLSAAGALELADAR